MAKIAIKDKYRLIDHLMKAHKIDKETAQRMYSTLPSKELSRMIQGLSNERKR